MNVITPADLHPGDIVLYHGNSTLGWLIRELDGTDVNHASIYLETGDRLHDQLAESLANGPQFNNRATSFAGNWYLIVRRLPTTLTLDPVVARARTIVAQGRGYAYAEIVVIAALVLVKKLDLPFYLKALLPPILRAATNLLEEWLSDGRKPLICSEFVWDCYEEADGPTQPYHFPYARPAVAAAASVLNQINQAGVELGAMALAGATAPTAPSLAEIEQLVQNVRDQHHESAPRTALTLNDLKDDQGDPIPALAAAFRGHDEAISLFDAVAAWPTPGDLLLTTALRTVGKLNPAL
jgi:hypothetical protein